MNYKTEIKRELNQTLLRIEQEEPYREDYQIRMLKENQIPGILKMHGQGMDDKTYYEYEISGKVSLKNRFQKKKITAEEMKLFLEQVLNAISGVTCHLLNVNCLLMDPEYIFWEEGHYYFCYLPKCEDDIWVSFHKLMDSFVQWTDYQDIPSVQMAFLLHKETMEENYSLKKIMDKMIQMEESEDEKSPKEAEPVQECEENTQRESSSAYDVADNMEEQDWITRQEMGSKILRETDNMWTPVKRFLQKHKKPKWGDWDGLSIDEEDF